MAPARQVMASRTKVTKRPVAKPAKKVVKKAAKSSPGKSATEAKFEYFGYLPPEIQSKIFTEALCKPHVHFMKAASIEKQPGTWSVKFNRKLGSSDPSGFQIFNSIINVSHNAARAVRLATIEKARMPFTERTQAIGNMDTSTDVVCVEFGVGQNNWRHFNWARGTQVMFPKTFDRDTPAADNLGIRRVAIIFNQGTPKPTKATPELSAVFRCSSPIHGGSRVCKVCPVEVMGFLDIFPDLEGFYIIIRSNADKTSREQVRVYKKNHFATTKQERQSRGLEEFHDRKHSYLEIGRAETPNIQPRQSPGCPHQPDIEYEIGRVFALIEALRTMFVAPDSNIPGPQRQFRMNLEKRKKVKITALLEAERA